MTLVDRDVLTVPAEEMKDTKILWTMVRGQVVWSANAADNKNPH